MPQAELQVLRQQQAARPAAVSAVSTPASEGGSCVSGGRVPPLRVSIAQEVGARLRTFHSSYIGDDTAGLLLLLGAGRPGVPASGHVHSAQGEMRPHNLAGL